MRLRKQVKKTIEPLPQNTCMGAQTFLRVVDVKRDEQVGQACVVNAVLGIAPLPIQNELP
jgi:hypothetical protein